jgi:hypothetical protein
MSLEIRWATESDLPGILRMYGQPGLIDEAVLSVAAAAKVLRRMETYPDYHVFVATQGGALVLLIMGQPRAPGCALGGRRGRLCGGGTATQRHRPRDDGVRHESGRGAGLLQVDPVEPHHPGERGVDSARETGRDSQPRSVRSKKAIVRCQASLAAGGS